MFSFKVFIYFFKLKYVVLILIYDEFLILRMNLFFLWECFEKSLIMFYSISVCV